MKNLILLFLLVFLAPGCSSKKLQDSFSVTLVNGFPQWLSTGGDSTQQTSGISFLRSDERGKQFLLADDVGVLHRLTIKKDNSLNLTPISFSDEVEEYLSSFIKADFEDILFDRYTGRIFVSIEGNEPEVRHTVGIYELFFHNSDPFTDSLVSIKKIIIEPEDELLKFTAGNIGFEGLAADENYYYIALEGFTEAGLFADSTVLYIVEKESLVIREIIGTKKAGIHTICGLYSDKNFSLYGIDRNNKNLFHMIFTPDLKVHSVQLAKVQTNIPNYTSFDYVSALESVTMDDSGSFYLVDDPWKKFYIPSEEILSKLDEKTVRMFKSYIPAIYKFKLN